MLFIYIVVIWVYFDSTVIITKTKSYLNFYCECSFIWIFSYLFQTKNAPELKSIKKLFWIKLDPTTDIFDCTKIAIVSSKCILWFIMLYARFMNINYSMNIFNIDILKDKLQHDKTNTTRKSICQGSDFFLLLIIYLTLYLIFY